MFAPLFQRDRLRVDNVDGSLLPSASSVLRVQRSSTVTAVAGVVLKSFLFFFVRFCVKRSLRSSRPRSEVATGSVRLSRPVWTV